MSHDSKIKTVYSFIASTIKLDLDTPAGEAIVQEIHPYACEKLRQENPEFDRLYSQVERENTPHMLGTGMATSPEGFAEAFSDWLKSKGVDIADADKEKKLSVFSGEAQDPESGLSFKWSVLFYFDIEEVRPQDLGENLSQVTCSVCGKTYIGEFCDNLKKAKYYAVDVLTYICNNCGAAICVKCKKESGFKRNWDEVECPSCGGIFGYSNKVLLVPGAINPANISYDKCWYCKVNPAENGAAAVIKFKSEHTTTSGKYQKVETRTETATIPRCSECKAKHDKARLMRAIGFIGGLAVLFVGGGLMAYIVGNFLYDVLPDWFSGWIVIVIAIIAALATTIGCQIRAFKIEKEIRPFSADYHPLVQHFKARGFTQVSQTLDV